MGKKKNRAGEMPFLDHLEELRWRILWSVAALLVASFVGFYLVQRFDVLTLLKIPIADHLPEEKLFFTRPTDAFLITLKLSVLLGAVLASPVIFRQAWTFLSPALYEHEKRYVMPAFLAGLGLFAAGVWMAYLWVLPAVLRVLLSPRFVGSALEPFITAGEYFAFAIQVILAFGFIFELPLIMVLLASLGLVSPRFFARNRHYAVAVGAVVAAFVTPPDVFSMIMMMVPIVVLYEVGIAIGRLVWNRRHRNTIGAAMLVFLAVGLGATPCSAVAQERPRRPDSAQVRPDSLPPGADSLAQPIDTAAAAELGLPTGPSRSFPSADSIMRELQGREQYRVTRYAADSLTFYALTREIDLVGSVLVEREGRTIEADSVEFNQANCVLVAEGDPKLFESGTVLVGETMNYDTCERRGIVQAALTNFNQSGVDWYLRGGLGIDSGSTRLFAGGGEITSCDLAEPHFHFAAGKVKWVTNTIMVARPAVLYIRDVPVLWLPFMFQDMRRGRRSGILVPRFGVQDLVRPSEGYSRHITNIGYYVALNDYVDVQASLDWFSGNSLTINGQMRYRWLNRFVTGGISMSRMFESGVDGQPGARSMRLRWNHQQSFNQRTRLTADVDFATSARVLERNSIDPFLQTATLRSTLNFNKQYDWGTLSLGGSRSQNLSDGLVQQTLPDFRLTPAPISLSSEITWSPSISFSTSRTLNQAAGTIPAVPLGGEPLEDDTLFTDTRTTSIQFATPIRVGRWNWQNDFRVADFLTDRRSVTTSVDPDNPADTVVRVYGEDFRTEVNWNTGFALPNLFGSSWKIQPSIGIQNSTSGPFMLRNRFTNGEFVQQGKRLSFAVSSSPTLFGFFPGLGPLSRIRHAISPQVRWNFAPAADVPEEFARALNPTAAELQLRSNPAHSVSFGISQIFEGKFRPPPDDTTGGRDARKIKLLSWQTSGIEFDFEQAKEEGRTGWRTQSLQNSFTSDLLPGFSLRTTHDLWDGPVGQDTTRFDPFLQRLSARFSISGATIQRLIGALFGGKPLEPPPEGEPADTVEVEPISTFPRPQGAGYAGVQSMAGPRAGRGFEASFSFNDQRVRSADDEDEESPRLGTPNTNRTLDVALAFSPAQDWSLSWNTTYNFTTEEFGQQVLRFDRDMHRWRATFSFVKTPNGNFAFTFFVTLMDQPEIKFNYDQQTVNR
jgi:Tat protein translocase TatC